MAAVRRVAVVIAQLREMLAGTVTVASVSEDLAKQEPTLTREDSDRLAHAIVAFVLNMCDGLAQAIRLSKDPRCGRAIAFGTGSVLHYLLDDDDLLPESSFGNLGLIDDAFLVHMFLAQLRETFPFADFDGSYEAPTDRDLAFVAELLPGGVAAALTRTCQSMVTMAAALFAAPVPVPDDQQAPDPTLRVREALAGHS